MTDQWGDPEQHMLILKPVSAWTKQVVDGLAKIKEANGGVDPPTLLAGDKLDHAAFASVIEAMVALEPFTRRIVCDELIAAAGLKPVNQVLYGD